MFRGEPLQKLDSAAPRVRNVDDQERIGVLLLSWFAAAILVGFDDAVANANPFLDQPKQRVVGIDRQDAGLVGGGSRRLRTPS